MAEILPIRPWRYNRELSLELDSLTSPLFDVVSEKQREHLYKNPLNSIHLSVPKTGGGDGASVVLNDWKERRILIQDKLSGIYVYYQYFRLSGSSKTYCRKGFICHIKVHDWSDRVILRHENTVPKAVNDRIDLLEKTELHANPTHGLYTDPGFSLEPYMDLAIGNPIYETEDYQGVRDVLAVIHDAAIIRKFIKVIESKKIILADGHHRYEGSLIYRHNRAAANPKHTGNEPYNYHLMYLTNTEAGDLRILPTHRLLTTLGSLTEPEFLERTAHYFSIKEIDDVDTLDEIIVGKRWTFGLIFKETAFKITLKPEVFADLSWPFPEEIKQLDLTVLHYFILEKVMGITGKHQRGFSQIEYDRSFSDCLKKVISGAAELAIITNEVTIEDVKRVCESGYTMPQKSTYFYPKVIGGFLFSSIKPSEFETSAYAPF